MNTLRVPRRVTMVLLMLGTSLCLTGCGQKGNLYLPNQKKKVPTTQPQPASQPPPASGSSSGAN
jgi:predicted small lipoprotein YifL